MNKKKRKKKKINASRKFSTLAKKYAGENQEKRFNIANYNQLN